ncbi:hypothetical protein [Methylobacterium sp. WL7]|uniref:tetratricopeptide repeat protein n=1 Tax=Methylobacterium sp. WL7 TaxID=2603900 RepID=UPI0011C99175|nr:hypothetical protein [Methylobacterium sp. WL7]TXN43409.1 hypothetical protein FV233_18620 [Methylobacterium sp. WL7]
MTDDFDARLLRAYKIFEAGNYADSLAACKDIIREDPSFRPAYYYGMMAGIYGGKMRDVIDLGMKAPQLTEDRAVLNWLGAALRSIGLPDFALSAHKRALKIEPNDTAGIFGVTQCALQVGDVSLARSVAGECGEHLGHFAEQMVLPAECDTEDLLAAGWLYGKYLVGISLFKLARWDEAVQQLGSAYPLLLQQEQYPLASAAGLFLCVSKAFASNKSGLRDIGRAAIQYFPEERWPEAFYGLGLLDEGCVEEALAILDRAKSRPKLGHGTLQGLNSILSLQEIKEVARSTECKDQEILGSDLFVSNEILDSAILVGCDGAYFEKLGLVYTGSLARQGDQVTVHFHVMNPTEGAVKLIYDFKRRFPNISIQYTTENIVGEVIELKAMYTTRRFVIARDLLCRRYKSLLVTDMDIAFTSSVGAFVKRIGSVDLGLMTEPSLFPWMSSPATISYFTNSELSLQFLSDANLFVDRVMKRRSAGENVWFVDQNALFAARLIARSRGARVANLSSIKPGLFSCYMAEGREAWIDRMMSSLELTG